MREASADATTEHPLRMEMAMTAVQNEPFPTPAVPKQNPSIHPVQKKEHKLITLI